MRYLVTGVKGQLGYDVVRELINRGINEQDIVGLDINNLDITDREAVDKVFCQVGPDVVFHCAAFTNVDLAEVKQADCYRVNVIGTRNISAACKALQAKLVYVSTDYVFDGTKEGSYEVFDDVNPLSVYGRSKYNGEQEVRECPKHFVARTSWVFGANGKNFIKTMINLASSHKELSIVDDQIGSPTYTRDLAKQLVELARTEEYGTYHVTNDNYCSWADLAEYVFLKLGYNTEINRVTTEEYEEMNTKKSAPRPKNSRLSKESSYTRGFDPLPDWKNAVDRYLIELKLLSSLDYENNNMLGNKQLIK
ncbi:MAG: dTDP-4-dehydrorhamnose reductase [Bacilli bacterium]